MSAYRLSLSFPERRVIESSSRDGLQSLGVLIPTEVGLTSVFDVGTNPCTGPRRDLGSNDRLLLDRGSQMVTHLPFE